MSTFIEKLDKLLGDPSKKYIKTIQPLVDKINALEASIQPLSDEELKAKTVEFKERIAKGETLDSLLPEAFAVVREASSRVIGQRHYDVQLIGGITLHQGNVAEMRTGEGKTLTSTAAVYLNALAGKGVHLVTVNDYLARRDCSWMGQIYNFLGLTIGCVQNQLLTYIYDHEAKADVEEVQAETEENEEESLAKKELVNSFKVDMDRLRRVVDRAEAYKCDITYGTNNEFGFDYLRDNMVQELSQKAQRGLAYAIIDEVDSILIDEARTPLIISAPDAESTEQYHVYKRIIDQLDPSVDYNVDEKMKAVSFTEAGQDTIARLLNRDPWQEMDYSTTFHLEAALKARALFKREVDYVVKDGEVVIVDEFTGRMMAGRRYSEGLHQALEAKEGLEVQRESKTLATITFQNLFRMYTKLSGMTGTAETEKEELLKIYGLDVVVIPTNKVIQRKDGNDLIYRTEQAKFEAVAKEVRECHEKGQPVLIGTISIEKNEQLSTLLDRAGVPHKILNAKNHESEAEIIAQAGRKGAVTLATNMAGRGVDIILGGNPPKAEESKEVKEAGGLYVIGTERHEARRIDNQLRGRAGRQGDPGSSRFFVSLEDDLMRIFGSDRIKKVMVSLQIPEDMPIENKMISSSIEAAQKKVEGNNFDVRKRLVEYDDVINKQRKAIYELRNRILDSENLETAHQIYKDKILELVQNEIEGVVLFHTAQSEEGKWDLKEVYEVAQTLIPIGESQKLTLEQIRKEAGDMEHDAEARTHIINYLYDLAVKEYGQTEETIGDNRMLSNIEKGLLLRAIDQYWVTHLEDMQHLRAGINLRGYGQRDPLVEYKKEAFELYNRMNILIQKSVAYSIFKIQSVVQVAPSIMQARQVEQGAEKEMQRGQKLGDAVNTMMKAPATQIRNEYMGQKVGRNDLCPCGSGLKYKKCHGLT